MKEIIVNENQASQRFDKLLKKLLPNAQTSFIYKMLRKKNIVLNDKKAVGNEILKLGDNIKLYFKDETFITLSGTSSINESSKFDEFIKAYKKYPEVKVIYEDNNFIFLNKPCGILTQKAKEDDYSLNEWLIGYLLQNKKITASEFSTFHPSVANRLDRNTSGIVLCGCSLFGLQYLNKVLKNRKLYKEYLTIVKGKITDNKLLKGYLVKNENTNKVEIFINKENLSKFEYIETEYKPIISSENFTLLRVHLITGKSHQIRAHLASIGHPILGDGKYGDKKLNKSFLEKYNLKNQLLHAYKISFPNATIQENEKLNEISNQTFSAAVPKEFEKIMKDLFPEYKNLTGGEINANLEF